MGRATTNPDVSHRRERWRSFLTEQVGRGRSISIASLDDKVAELSGRRGDARGEIYRYLKQPLEAQSVGSERAFWIGEALRDLGVAWCSGTVALYAARHLGAFVKVLENFHREETLAGICPRGLAPWFAVLAPLAVEPEATELNFRDAARRVLAEVAGDALFISLRNAFARDSQRGADPMLAGIETLAASEAALAVLEPAVRGALREWALFAVDAESRKWLVTPILKAEIARLEGLRFFASILPAPRGNGVVQ